MSATTRLLTHADLDQFPDDGKRREIIGGELYVSAAPVRKHQQFSKVLFRLFDAAVETTGWGEVYYAPVDVEFAEHDIVEPDLIVIRRDRLHLYRGNTFYGAPDIIVEILSPSNRAYDEVKKLGLYGANGVPEYWIADPMTPSFRMLTFHDGQYAPVEPDGNGRLRSTVVPGLTVDPAQLLTALAASSARERAADR